VREAFPTKASKTGVLPPANARVVLSDAARAALRLLPNQATRELLEGAGVALG